MAKKSVPAPSPLTFDLPVSLLTKIELHRKALGLTSTSAVVRHALESFDLSQFESSSEERRQISVRLAFNDKALLVKAAKKQGVSLGELLRAAVDALALPFPEKKAPEKKAPAPKPAAPKPEPKPTPKKPVAKTVVAKNSPPPKKR